MLGLRGKDKVTSFEGTISSISFDLYGCVQVALTPCKETEGKLGESYWFDVHRIEVAGKKRVMDVPHFQALARKPKEYSHGPAEKPAPKS